MRGIQNNPRCIILDLDGVVYAGQKALPGAVQAIEQLRSAGKILGFLTNNSTQSPEGIAKRLQGLGISCQSREILTSSLASCELIRDQTLDQERGIFIVGAPGLVSQAQAMGLTLSGPEDCGALLVGHDPVFSYETLSRALTAALRPIPWVICNRDPHYPIEGGKLMPACGAIVAAIEGASNRKPDFEIGKPNPKMVQTLARQLGVSLNDAIVVGDSLTSDIAMARSAGLPSVWISSEPANQKTSVGPEPDWISPSLHDWVTQTF